jgi:ABC-type transport system involved in multi-copper enzyme maturation permease subunit
MTTSATRSTTYVLLRDELIGYFKSKVMLVLWILMPLVAIGGYFVLPSTLRGGGFAGASMSATMFMSLLMSSLAGTVASIMVAVDIVSERNRRVYDLFVIRPVRRDAIIWAKFLAVFGCVTIACFVSIALGLGLDAIRGEPPTAAALADAARSLATLGGVLAMSTAGGVCIGVLARSILVAVILVLYVGQNLTFLPMLPGYFGVVPNLFWLVILISFALAALVVYVSGVMFRRAEM